jgi:hypothetical protein
MGLKPGTRFVAISQGDAVMLKVVSPPSVKDFAALAARLRRKAREAGLTRKDVARAVASARRRS